VDVVVTAPGFGEARRSGVLLEVGQTASLAIELPLEQVRETVVVDGGVGVVAVDTSRSVVDAVIPAALIDALPLNGRNFLELAFLIPGNAPAPNFDPTKATSVIVSSAGQLGAGRQHHDRRGRQQRRRRGRARSRTSPRRPCRSSRSPPTVSRPSPGDRPRRSSTS
jgi:hypothetical protein